jgi:hypothetical protein
MVGSSWVSQTGNVSKYGQWLGGATGCAPPEFASDQQQVVLESQDSYRLAVTMRRANGSSVTYPIGYSTQVPY